MAEAQPVLEVRGVNGQIRLYDDHITISHKGLIGFLGQGIKGDKTILTRQISSVQFHGPGLTNGYIQFAFLGGQENKGGVFAATHDENTVMFNRGQRGAFEGMRDAIMRRIGAGLAPGASSTEPTSVADELSKLAALRDSGVLSAEEFETQKRKVLSAS